MSATRLDTELPLAGDGAAPVGRALPPPWLRPLGTTAWLLIGVFVVLGAVFWALSAATTIVGPLVAGGIVATVASPLVARMERHHVRRGWGALIVLLTLIVVAAGIALAVIAGVSDQAAAISEKVSAAAAKLKDWLQSAGVPEKTSEATKSGTTSATQAVVKGMTGGLVEGIKGVTSIALGISFTAFSIFFLLKDGPKLRATLSRNLGVPEPVGKVVVGRLIGSLRGYFLGVTIVAVFNGVVTALGAWLLGVPLAATIGIVTFALAYVPFIGAFVAGAFAVLIALGANGTTTAVGMLVVCLLANGLLQNIVSPLAMGAALEMNPLLNLAVTVGAGCLFGMFGLVLAAPLTSAALHLADDLRALRGDAAVPAASPRGSP